MTKSDSSRTAILERSVDLASVVGLEGLTIGALASNTGFSKSGLFAHFGSKENLQLETLRAAADRFTNVVIKPALHIPRGVQRVQALFDRWLDWAARDGLPGGCLFVTAAIELDDQDGGQVREYLVEQQRAWQDLIARTAEFAVGTGDLRPDLDCRQFAHELQSLFLGFNHAQRLMRDRAAEDRTRAAFARLLADARRIA